MSLLSHPKTARTASPAPLMMPRLRLCSRPGAQGRAGAKVQGTWSPKKLRRLGEDHFQLVPLTPNTHFFRVSCRPSTKKGGIYHGKPENPFNLLDFNHWRLIRRMRKGPASVCQADSRDLAPENPAGTKRGCGLFEVNLLGWL